MTPLLAFAAGALFGAVMGFALSAALALALENGADDPGPAAGADAGGKALPVCALALGPDDPVGGAAEPLPAAWANTFAPPPPRQSAGFQMTGRFLPLQRLEVHLTLESDPIALAQTAALQAWVDAAEAQIERLGLPAQPRVSACIRPTAELLEFLASGHAFRVESDLVLPVPGEVPAPTAAKGFAPRVHDGGKP